VSILDLLTAILIVIGAIFFLAGTIGLLRFPDLHSRIHSLTKADNLGLGFIVLGLLLQAESVAVAIKIILIWLLALAAAATSGYLIGNHALESADDD
jgi:multicomponent Na+:H+ antiporter subunit G